ncbi:hypothetical protein MTYM_02305 [Methylococcales bacterium]|nr:hypothetical protein MTYM_02305 [Methylococcales bacterium]
MLPRASHNKKLKTQPFLDWAGDKWPELHTALRMPFKVKPVGIEPGGVPSPRILVFPPDDQMKAGYEEKCREIWALHDHIQELMVRLDSGGFRCMVCGAHGGNVLAFHMQRHGLGFIEAARALGAWEAER